MHIFKPVERLSTPARLNNKRGVNQDIEVNAVVTMIRKGILMYHRMILSHPK